MVGMDIPDKAVEAAARETYRVAAEFAYETDSWDDLSDGQREAFAEDAKKILEAASAHMKLPSTPQKPLQQFGTLPEEYQPLVHFSPNRADIFYTNPRRSQP